MTSIPRYDRWKLDNGETLSDIREERRLEALAERYEEDFEDFIKENYSSSEIEDLKDLGLI